MQKNLPTNSSSIQYLGVGGQLFRFGQHTIMTALSITNPHFLLLGPFIPISADTDMIDRYLPDVSHVESILVGHAHYDHLMDVPYIMQNKAKKSHIYGSKTIVHSIAPAIENLVFMHLTIRWLSLKHLDDGITINLEPFALWP